MAVKIRRSKERLCNSCKSNGGKKFYDIGIGPQKSDMNITTLCDTCIHSLLQKLILMGKEE